MQPEAGQMETIDRPAGAHYEHEEGGYGLVRCYDCGRENYSLAVSVGICYWCGSDRVPDENGELFSPQEEARQSNNGRDFGA